MRQVFRLPDAGEGLTEAEILSWQVAVGDTVAVNQVIVEIETAKAAVELPSPYAGTVTELLVKPGVTVQVGTPIIAITDGADDPVPAPMPAPAASTSDPARAGNGAKIGESGVDGRIATLVGYGPRPGSVTRAPPHDLPASRGFSQGESGIFPSTPHRPRPGPPAPLRRRSGRPPGPPTLAARPPACRWPSRRCASWPRSWASTCARWPALARTA